MVPETSPRHSQMLFRAMFTPDSHTPPNVRGKFRIFTNLRNDAFFFDLGHSLLSLSSPLHPNVKICVHLRKGQGTADFSLNNMGGGSCAWRRLQFLEGYPGSRVLEGKRKPQIWSRNRNLFEAFGNVIKIKSGYLTNRLRKLLRNPLTFFDS